MTLAAYDHQEVPFDQLVRELKGGRSLSQNTLFQVMFVHEKVGAETFTFAGLDLSMFVIETGTSMFDLTLSIMESAENLSCSFTYNTDLFDGITISRIMQQFQTILESIVANPATGISGLPILQDPERQQLLVQWNDTEREYIASKCVHRIIEEQSKRTPDAVAVVLEGQQLTYRELNLRANQLAHYLSKRGVGPEVSVAIFMERSLNMIVALLGVLKAGGAYVPLDPGYPIQRLTLMLAQAGASVVITETNLLSHLSWVDGAKRSTIGICLDAHWDEITRESDDNPEIEVDLENLAYVIYTSGSTGSPKRVGITNRSLTNYSQCASDLFELQSSDRVLQFASLSFDTSAEEIFPCLTRGATLVLRTSSMIDSAASFLQRINDWRISVLDLPTAYWHELTEEMSSETLSLPDCLRMVIIGGERAAAKAMLNRRFTEGEPVRLLNTYGPTETTVTATVWELTATAFNDDWMEVPIGHPVSNTQVYILDCHLEPVPIGVAGELYIGGAGLARGYLDHSDQTAAKFIPNPFNVRVGDRLYRSGDLARYRADGNIEFLGRTDRQVKLRGFRIELGEIEAVLSRHQQVRQVAVVVRDDAANEDPSAPQRRKRLVAYIVPAQPETLSTADLRNFVQAALPEYMVPVFVLLDALPLTVSRKIDYRMLPEPGLSRPELAHDISTPRNPVEELLETLWAEILGIGQVGIHDNFFDLGGHSLMATQLVSRIRKTFGVEIPLRSLFESPSIAALAVRIEELRRYDRGLQTGPILPMSRAGDLESVLRAAAAMVLGTVRAGYFSIQHAEQVALKRAARRYGVREELKRDNKPS